MEDLELGETPSTRKRLTQEERDEQSKFYLSRPCGDPEAEYTLYYWPSLAGRGEWVRLMFVEGGVDWYDIALDPKKRSFQEVLMWIKGEQDKELNPVFAPPIIRRKSDNFVLAETAAICQYLGRKFGLCPKTDELEFRAAEIAQSALDFVGQGRLSFHVGPNKTESYFTQTEACKPHIEEFRKTRMPRFLQHFERVIAHNQEKYPGTDFVVGENVSFADVVLWQVLVTVEFQCPEAYEGCSIPLLKKFQATFAERPKIKAYCASARRGPPSGDSFM